MSLLLYFEQSAMKECDSEQNKDWCCIYVIYNTFLATAAIETSAQCIGGALSQVYMAWWGPYHWRPLF